jgi:predicted small lipoprotein YifL
MICHSEQPPALKALTLCIVAATLLNGCGIRGPLVLPGNAPASASTDKPTNNENTPPSPSITTPSNKTP